MDIIKHISKVACWKCDGSGTIEIPYISDEDLSSQNRTLNCPICDGKGILEMINLKNSRM